MAEENKSWWERLKEWLLPSIVSSIPKPFGIVQRILGKRPD
jgi:hypothetical protein